MTVFQNEHIQLQGVLVVQHIVQQHPPFFRASALAFSSAFSVSNPFFAIVSNTSLTLISDLAEVSKKSTFSPHSFARASPSALGTARSSGKSTLLPQSATGGIGLSSRSFIRRSSSNLAFASSTLALSIIEYTKMKQVADL